VSNVDGLDPVAYLNRSTTWSQSIIHNHHPLYNYH
jgi:hypothetical protein